MGLKLEGSGWEYDPSVAFLKSYAKMDALISSNYGKFDTELMGRQMTSNWGTNPYSEPSRNWIDDQRKKAELEAQKERVRQAFRMLDDVKSSRWVGGLIYIEGATDLEQLKHACESFGIVWKDEGDMVTKSTELANLKAELAKVQAKIDKLEHGRLGKEPANGFVFKIEKRYDRYGKGYAFAAIRADGLWYLTGTGADGKKSYTWEQLKNFIGNHSRVWAMTAKEELVD